MKTPAELVKAHWKEFQPERYKELEQTGELEKAAQIVQAKVADRMIELTDTMNYEEARQLAYQELIFTPPEDSVTLELMETDEEE